MFFLDRFMDFIYRHPLYGKIFKYIFAMAISVVAIVTGIIYLKTGRFLFDLDLFIHILDENRKYVYMVLIAENIILIGALIWKDYKLKTRANCSVKYIHLNDIAYLWLEAEDYKDALREEVRKQVEEEQSSNVLLPNTYEYPEFEKNKTNEIYQRIIAPNIERLSNEERVIIIDLLKLLEDKGDIPSVASYYDKDPEIKYKDEIVSTDGLNSYKVLRNITLYDHTLNVLEEIYAILDKRGKTQFAMLFGKAVVSALAHDIGKIQKIEEKVKKVSIEIFRQQPHHIVSKLIFIEMFPSYESRDIVVEAIENHHAVKLPNNGNELIKMLVDADKLARKREIERYILDKNVGKPLTKRLKKNKKSKDDKDLENEQKLKEELEKVYEEKRMLEDAVLKDSLTRAYNRMCFEKDIDLYFAEHKDTMIFAMIDGDNFKKINDTYGHLAGDQVLKKIVDVIYSEVREYNGKVYRYGGEEFAVVIPDMDEESGKNLFKKICTKIENSGIEFEEKEIKFTVSIGMVTASGCATINDLIANADKALYDAKKSGKNRVFLYGKEENKIKKSIKNKDKDKKDKKNNIVELSDIDFDVGAEFGIINKDGKNNEDTKKNEFVNDNKKEIKTDKIEFEFDEYEGKIFDKLSQMINKAYSSGLIVDILSVSYKDMILFDWNTVKNVIEEVVSPVDSEKMTRYFVEEAKKRNVVGYIDIDNGYYSSKFVIDLVFQKVEFNAIPIFGRVFGLDEAKLENSKLKDDVLNKAKVYQYSEYHENV
ncbi:diguanylate cyclase [Nitrosophilus labii]|uniref:diguanylate cyclase n=1 Tax=Nitrosophilus labii TaxID=2706014 RepID=UPI0016571A70|nr:diguanylate cyclase [Nitrosophilus labii]